MDQDRGRVLAAPTAREVDDIRRKAVENFSRGVFRMEAALLGDQIASLGRSQTASPLQELLRKTAAELSAMQDLRKARYGER